MKGDSMRESTTLSPASWRSLKLSDFPPDQQQAMIESLKSWSTPALSCGSSLARAFAIGPSNLERLRDWFETFTARAQGAYTRKMGVRPERPESVSEVFDLACEVLTQAGLRVSEIGQMMPNELLEALHREVWGAVSPLGSRDRDTSEPAPTKSELLPSLSEYRTPKWYSAATNDGIRKAMLRQAHRSRRLARYKRGYYCVEDVCRLWPQYESAIRKALMQDDVELRRGASKCVALRAKN
jgi:hypothetical protein